MSACWIGGRDLLTGWALGTAAFTLWASPHGNVVQFLAHGGKAVKDGRWMDHGCR